MLDEYQLRPNPCVHFPLDGAGKNYIAIFRNDPQQTATLKLCRQIFETTGRITLVNPKSFKEKERFGLSDNPSAQSSGSFDVPANSSGPCAGAFGVSVKPVPGSWPSKQDISRYIIMKPSGDSLVTSVASEVYIVNRADRPVMVYFPKDVQIGQLHFKDGSLFTMDDLKHFYDDFGKNH